MLGKMFGIKNKMTKKIENEIIEKINKITDLEYLISCTCEEIEDVIEDNKLNLSYEKTIITVNTIKFYFSIYKKIDETGKTVITNVKKVESYIKDFQRINPRIVIITDEKMICFQIPRLERDIVYYNCLIEKITLEELKLNYKLPIICGVDEKNEIIVHDLEEKPHTIIAGTTGSGKSNITNSIICTLLLLNDPTELQFAFIDPKGGIELSWYEDLEKYLFDSIKIKSEESIEMIYKIHDEMNRRYEFMKKYKVKKIESLHNLGIELPRLVLVIDEFANVATSFSNKKLKDEFDSIMTSLLQMARAAGIHIIMATQRPSVDVITGSIKANVPFRIGFCLPSSHDSKTVIDTVGLEKLLGNGDGLIYDNGSLLRIQSSFIADEEIETIVEYVKNKYADVEENENDDN